MNDIGPNLWWLIREDLVLLSANHWRFRNTVKAVCAFALIWVSLCLANSEAKTILETLTFFQILTSKMYVSHVQRNIVLEHF